MKKSNIQGTPHNDKWMTVKNVADYLQMSTETIYRLAQRGEIPATKVASQWRFKKERIDEWMKRNENAIKN